MPGDLAVADQDYLQTGDPGLLDQRRDHGLEAGDGRGQFLIGGRSRNLLSPYRKKKTCGDDPRRKVYQEGVLFCHAALRSLELLAH